MAQDMLWPAVGIVIGFALLIGGGELLVRGASRLAVRLGIAPLVIGFTVVAFATSAPELAVSLKAVYAGSGDLAVGNLVGSNIANLLLILGLSALMAPLAIASRVIRIDVPLVVAASVLLLVLGLDGVIGALDGLFMSALLAAYILWSLRMSARNSAAFGDADAQSSDAPGTSGSGVPLMASGLLLLGLGAHWLVQGAVAVAEFYGLQELVIGLTVIAVGTSLPELVTSVIAVLRGARDMAVGNLLGSNLFNILGVLGVTGMLAPQGLVVPDAALALDMPVMIASAVACLPIFFTGHRIARWEGGLFFAYYLAYMAYLVLDATGHRAEADFAWVMGLFVIPLTVVTLGVCSVRALRGDNAALDEPG